MRLDIPSESDSQRAVSPVIGVILMVAITVILAAVIGTFVLGLGDQVSQTAPQASISVSDTRQASGESFSVLLKHGGGDDIVASDTSVKVSQETGVSFDADLNNTDTALSTANIMNITYNGTNAGIANQGRESVRFGGERVFAAGLTNATIADEPVSVTIVDGPSGQIIAEKTAEI